MCMNNGNNKSNKITLLIQVGVFYSTAIPKPLVQIYFALKKIRNHRPLPNTEWIRGVPTYIPHSKDLWPRTANQISFYVQSLH